MSQLAALVSLMRPSRRALIFSGAGISTGSGIPDFRGPQGVWTRRQPVYYDDFLAAEAARVEYWEQKLEGYEQFRDAVPNAAHRAVAELERSGRLAAVVTQNIDGLHQRAGCDPAQVIELHGTNRLTACVQCERRADPAPAMAYFRQHRRTPACDDCGGFLKMATISFGQSLDPSVLSRAVRAAEQADLVLALGSTLSVHPAASIPLISARSGAPYAVINRGETEHDSIATLKIDADVVDVLPRVVAELG